MDDLNGRVGEVREEVRVVRRDIGDLKRTMIQIGGGLIGTLAVAVLGLIGTQI